MFPGTRRLSPAWRVVLALAVLSAGPIEALDGGLANSVSQVLPSQNANLIGYWPMNGQHDDLSGNGNAGGPLAGAGLPGFSTVDPVNGTAAGLFDGGNALAVSSNASFNGAQLSWAVWVKCTLIMSPTSNSGHTLFTFLDNGNPYVPVASAHLIQDGSIKFGIKGAGTVVSPPDGGFGATHWTHVAGTFDGAALRLYIDGQPVQQVSAPGAAVLFNNSALWIGRFWPTGAPLYNPQYFQGEMDELAIWRVALSPPEIQALATGLVWDGGPPIDAGVPDAGVADGGDLDDGGSPDAGAPRLLRVGCGCTALDGHASALGLLGLLLCRALRRRRQGVPQ